MKKIKIFLFLIWLMVLIIPATIPARAEDNCAWRAEITQTNPELGGSQTTGGCYSNETRPEAGSEIKCSEARPANSSSGFISTRYVCCCKVVQTPVQPKTPKFIMPELQINIPTLKLTASSSINYITNDDGSTNVAIPWISEYIVAIYNYGLSVAGILAAIILMAGGVLWLVSGGDASKVTQAKELITGSVIGLVILASSYVLLIQINPNLVKFKPITLGTIKKSFYPDNETAGNNPNPYASECIEAKNGNLVPCQNLGTNGKKPTGLVAVDGTEASAQIIASYQKAIQCVADKNGGKILFSVNEGWRSPLTQIDYYNKYGAGKAATPCCSNHGAGQALDLKRTDKQPMSWDYNNTSGLTACMNKNSLYAGLNNEPWHWSPSGK